MFHYTSSTDFPHHGAVHLGCEWGSVSRQSDSHISADRRHNSWKYEGMTRSADQKSTMRSWLKSVEMFIFKLSPTAAERTDSLCRVWRKGHHTLNAGIKWSAACSTSFRWMFLRICRTWSDCSGARGWEAVGETERERLRINRRKKQRVGSHVKQYLLRWLLACRRCWEQQSEHVPHRFNRLVRSSRPFQDMIWSIRAKLCYMLMLSGFFNFNGLY